MWEFLEALLELAFARKAKAPRFTPRGCYSDLSTQELNHRADNFYFDLVNSKLSVYEKQKPRDLHRGAFTQNCEPVLLKSVGLTGSIRACHSNHECTGKQQGRNLAVPPLTTWPVLRRQCSRAVHKHCRLFCEEPTSGIEPLPLK